MQKIEIMAFLEALFLHLAYLIERFYYVNDIFLSKYYRLFLLQKYLYSWLKTPHRYNKVA